MQKVLLVDSLERQGFLTELGDARPVLERAGAEVMLKRTCVEKEGKLHEKNPCSVSETHPLRCTCRALLACHGCQYQKTPHLLPLRSFPPKTPMRMRSLCRFALQKAREMKFSGR